MNHGVDKTADICTYISLYDICICIILRFCNYADRIKTKHPDSYMFFGMPRGLQFVRSLFFCCAQLPLEGPRFRTLGLVPQRYTDTDPARPGGEDGLNPRYSICAKRDEPSRCALARREDEG